LKPDKCMSVKEEIKNIIAANKHNAPKKIFGDLVFCDSVKKDVLTSLISGHNILLTGPTGSGKTQLAIQIGTLLSARQGVKNCPLHCYAEDKGCPWCEQLELKEMEKIEASQRVVRIQGNSEITPEDIIGDLDPVAAINYGIRSSRAFVPGKALRSNHGLLVLDFIDKMPERAMNALIQAIEGDCVYTSHFDDKIPLDSLIIGTAGSNALEMMPIHMSDHFDVIKIDYIKDVEEEKNTIISQAVFRDKCDLNGVIDNAIKIIRETRSHGEIKRGVSTRGGIKFFELLNASPKVYKKDVATNKDIREAAVSALPHRLELEDHIASVKTAEEVLQEILDDVLKVGEKAHFALSKESIMSIAKEIATRTEIKRPLKYGFYDILLKRIQRFPDSELSKLHTQIRDKLDEKENKEELTEELLEQVEDARKLKARMIAHKKKLDMKALDLTIDTLSDIGMLEKTRDGYLMGQKGISCLLEMLFPHVVGKVRVHGYGKHAIGKKSQFGTGRIVGTRKYHLGDSYKNVSYKDTLREAIRNRRKKVTRDDIRINKKDIRSQLFIVLSIDLSGTMSELDKLWYAKETSGAVALSSLSYKDKVGVVSFSNLADDVVEITQNPYKIMSGVVDLDLHENAFTNIGYGIRKAKEMLLRYRKSSAARHMIVISDGDATAPDPSPDNFAIREAKKAAGKGITISTVCINQISANPDLMQNIARIGKGRMYTIEKSENLTSAVLEDVSQARVNM